MHKFLLVKPKTNWARTTIVDRFVTYAEDCLAFAPDRVSYYQVDDCYIFSAEIKRVDAENYSHVFIHENSCFMFDGLPFTDAGAYCTADTFARDFAHADVGRIFEEVYGTFSVVRINTGDIEAFCDFSGNSPLFYLENDHYFAVTNRQFLMAKICEETLTPSIDLEALSWLTGQSNILGVNAVFKGVKLLLPGYYLSCKADRVTCTRLAKQFWNGESKDLTSDDYEYITQQLVKQVNAISKLKIGRLSFYISGGFDSRAVLALSKCSGLSEHIDEYVTHGRIGSPEAEVTKAMAERFGFSERYYARLTKPAKITKERVWDGLKNHIFQFDASVCPWDGELGGGMRGSQIVICGLGGEIFQKFVKAHAKVNIKSLNEALSILAQYQQISDPLALQNEHFNDYQERAMRQIITEMYSDGVRLNDLTDVLYGNFRQTWWNGIINSNSIEKFTVSPLLDFKAVRRAYCGDYKWRQMYRFHAEIIKRTCGEMLSFPFLGKSWDSRLTPYIGKENIVPEYPVSQKYISANMVAWQWDFLQNAWNEIKDFLLSFPNSGLLDIVNREQLECVFTGEPFTGQAGEVTRCKEILSLVGMQILLTRGYKSNQEKSNKTPEIRTNIPNLNLVNNNLIVGFKLKKYTFDLPKGTIEFRIDPIDKLCNFAVGKIYIKIDNEKIELSPNGYDNLTLRNAEVIQRNPMFTFYKSNTKDPNIYLADMQLDESFRNKESIRVTCELWADVYGNAVVYHNSGSGGYTEANKTVQIADNQSEKTSSYLYDRSEKDLLRSAIDRLEAEKTRQKLEAEKEIQRLETEKDRQRLQAEKEIQRLETEKDRQRFEAEKERRKLKAERENQYNAFINSTSWKITAPFRKITSATRQVIRRKA